MSSIPIVDLAKLQGVQNISKDADCMSIAAKVREGLGTVGFLYLVNHGISQEVISNVLSQSRQFFKLDSTVKSKYQKDTRVSSENGQLFDIDQYFGYTLPGGERLHPDAKVELKEIYDWLDGRGKYPDAELPQFESSIAQLDKECKSFLKKFFKILAISLDLPDENYFLNCCRHFDDPTNYKGIYNMRILHYPPIGNDDDGEKFTGATRCAEHSDYGLLTLLFQDDAGGLEVKNVEGEWIQASPVPGSVILNVGDLTEFWTSGIFPATPHRVIIPDEHDAKRKKSRYSIAFFNGPDTDTLVTPLDVKPTSDEITRLAKTGKKYKKEPINAWEHMMGRIAKQYT